MFLAAITEKNPWFVCKSDGTSSAGLEDSRFFFASRRAVSCRFRIICHSDEEVAGAWLSSSAPCFDLISLRSPTSWSCFPSSIVLCSIPGGSEVLTPRPRTIDSLKSVLRRLPPPLTSEELESSVRARVFGLGMWSCVLVVLRLDSLFWYCIWGTFGWGFFNSTSLTATSDLTESVGARGVVERVLLVSFFASTAAALLFKSDCVSLRFDVIVSMN
mmetsp:Transcript_15714/g.38761  ORF Transcript_15714/g.38761 Transcript_15714/m.38761 type:complete len:216 (+) Transcript_15714:2401-3048(+)